MDTDRHTDRRLVFAWYLWFAAIVLILAAALVLPGCASESARPIPPCADVEGSALETPRGTFYVFDEENLAKLNRRQRMLQRGECRLDFGDEAR